jgi:flagellar biosynthetic protein FliR
MNTVWFSEAVVESLLASLPVFGRILGLIVGFPVLGQKGVPVQTKVGLSLLLTALLAPHTAVPMKLNMLQRAALCGEELVVGLCMGFVARMIFVAVQVAGQFVEVPIGLGMSGVLDLTGGARVPLFGQFYYFLIAMVFLTVDGHLAVLRALGDSFRLLPPGSPLWREGAVQVIIKAFADMFLAGVAVAIPILAAVLVTDTVLALANRAVPQLSIFSIGFPLKTAVGLLAAMVSLPFLIHWAVGALGPEGALIAQVYGFLQGLR